LEIAMEIFIPSSGRANAQVTYHELPKEIRERVKIVVPRDEVRAYKKYPTITGKGVVRDICKVRQWILERAENKFIMLDDDLVFAIRREDEPTKFRPATLPDIRHLFETIESLLGGYAHVGIATREGGNRNTADYLENGRMIRALAYCARVLRQEEVRFDRVKGREDLDMTLQLLRAGLDNKIVNWAVTNQGGSNSKGGCAQWRTFEVMDATARQLHKLHPDYVRLVEKTTKTAWGGGTRTEVVISWKRAFDESQS
jgi:hypothetical protein